MQGGRLRKIPQSGGDHLECQSIVLVLGACIRHKQIQLLILRRHRGRLLESRQRLVWLAVSDVRLSEQVLYVRILVPLFAQAIQQRNRLLVLTASHVAKREVEAGRIFVRDSPSRRQQMRNGLAERALPGQSCPLPQFVFRWRPFRLLLGGSSCTLRLCDATCIGSLRSGGKNLSLAQKAQ